MNKLLVNLLVSILFQLGTFNASALTGNWRQHFAFNNCFSIIETPLEIIGATKMGLIKLDKQNQSLSTITRINGLSDYGITAINYSPQLQSIIIGYENGNIDIISNGQVTNINDLKIHPMEGSKRVNYVHPHGNQAFLATDFGILVVDLEKKEIEATYFIGENATNVRVNQITSDANFLYAATSQGVLRVAAGARDKHIYSAWSRISPDNSTYSAIITFADGVVAARGVTGEGSTLVYLSGNQAIFLESIALFRNLRNLGNQFMAVSDNAIRFYDSSFITSQVITGSNLDGNAFTPAFRDAIVTMSDQLWVADFNLGMLRQATSGNFSQFIPPGPFTNQVHHARFIGNRLWVVPGGITTPWDNTHTEASVSILHPSGWQTLTQRNAPLLAGATDLLTITPNPRNPDNVFINSWGSGIFETNVNNNKVEITNHFFTPPNGIQSATGDQRRFVRVSYSKFDRDNVLWIVNSSVDAAIVAYYPGDGTWIRYNYGIPANMQGMTPLLITSWGEFWLPIIREGGITKGAKGIFVWANNNTPRDQRDDRYRGAVPPALDADTRNQGQLLLWDESGKEITNNIFALAEDHNGHIWMGTDRGVVVQYNPRSILTRQRPVFSRLLVPRRDGSGLADFLLEHEVISAIAIDPANRKWIGTQGNGAFLVSEDGNAEIHAFNTRNSPLPSDFISAITIDETTGEVFFATSNGLVSFMGTATRATADYSGISVFPNPVRPGFQGNITITGLMSDSNIKITSVSGSLVYETTSTGGQAFWNGQNLWGEPVKSGIYLIFATTPNGEQAGATKVAIIR